MLVQIHSPEAFKLGLKSRWCEEFVSYWSAKPCASLAATIHFLIGTYFSLKQVRTQRGKQHKAGRFRVNGEAPNSHMQDSKIHQRLKAHLAISCKQKQSKTKQSRCLNLHQKKLYIPYGPKAFVEHPRSKFPPICVGPSQKFPVVLIASVSAVRKTSCLFVFISLFHCTHCDYPQTRLAPALPFLSFMFL